MAPTAAHRTPFGEPAGPAPLPCLAIRRLFSFDLAQGRGVRCVVSLAAGT
jgi:hypothetical protein